MGTQRKTKPEKRPTPSKEVSALRKRREKLLVAYRKLGIVPNPANIKQVAVRIPVMHSTLYKWENGTPVHATFLRRWREVILEISEEYERKAAVASADS